MDEERTRINLDALDRDYKLRDAYSNVRNLEFRSDKKRLRTQTFAQFLRTFPDIERRFQATRVPRPKYPADEAYRNRKLAHLYSQGDMLVLVEKALYPQIKQSLQRYVLDVGRDGYWANIYLIDGGKPTNVRHFIATRRTRPKGVLMVGAIAAPWFEHQSSQFPCDLFYMDLNGEWNDVDANGMYDSHDGHLSPEIWVGRLWTPTKGGSDAKLLNDYFERNHEFRLGQLGHARSALAYVDDDWQGFGDCAFDQMFPPSSIEVYTDPLKTDADLYKSEVHNQRSWVQLCAHSWVKGHALRTGDTNEYIGVDYFRDTNPPNAHFYNLFCCGPGKYTIPDYLAGWYVFDKKSDAHTPGLAAIASAKSGSMLFFEDFYGPLGQGKVIGDAFVDWWKARGPDHEDWEKGWFYGLVLLGDPTLAWWKGTVPQPRLPEAGDTFDHWPRKTEFRWDPVDLPQVKYSVEVDALGAVHGGQWAEETGQTFRVFHNIPTNKLEHNFVGAQRGRWRVRAVVDGRKASWSPWRYFNYTA